MVSDLLFTPGHIFLRLYSGFCSINWTLAFFAILKINRVELKLHKPLLTELFEAFGLHS